MQMDRDVCQTSWHVRMWRASSRAGVAGGQQASAGSRHLPAGVGQGRPVSSIKPGTRAASNSAATYAYVLSSDTVSWSSLSTNVTLMDCIRSICMRKRFGVLSGQEALLVMVHAGALAWHTWQHIMHDVHMYVHCLPQLSARCPRRHAKGRGQHEWRDALRQQVSRHQGLGHSDDQRWSFAEHCGTLQ